MSDISISSKPPKYKRCEIEGCDGNSHYSVQGKKGMCSKHYQRFRAHGANYSAFSTSAGRCKVNGCQNKGVLNKSGSRTFPQGYCGMHYQRLKHHGNALFTKKPIDGRSTHSLYSIWSNMKTRCYNEKSINFKHYGGKGIRMSDRWLNGENGKSGFACFVDDVGERPSPKHTIDRINSEGDYTKFNTRWADRHKQAANRKGVNKIAGVRWDKGRGKWAADITVNGHYYFLGRFAEYKTAVKARKQAEIRYGVHMC